MYDFMDAYLGGITDSQENLTSWLRSFQELDAHSVYHLLHLIEQPMLVISGFFDMLTPPMQSVEIAQRVPRASLYIDPLSSHASLLESPEYCLAEIEHFLVKNSQLRRTSRNL